ncbi:hypothetical protein [Streptacidiphilus rugosus]|uniref:hypothetical protein n=1 Tax=Streptacidiphilus rugosus TaxID=405783 RepID=UPI000AF4F2A9|nr:hypothetical protein [Streptacidiphilus rugosus]
MFVPRRLACSGCGATADWEPRLPWTQILGAAVGDSQDPFFRQPLWLQTFCAGRVLWAYNEEHVDALAAFVDARLRESGPLVTAGSMFARLPLWMKRADNRSDVTAGLEALKALAQRSAPADRSDAAFEHGDLPRALRSGRPRT